MRLEVTDWSAGYHHAPIVQSADLAFDAEHITGIIGPNGAGKSTLLKSLFGGAQVLSGSIRIDGDVVVKPTARDLLARGLAYVPQLNNVFPSLSVTENLQMGVVGWHSRPVDEVVDVFPQLRALLHRQAGKLSGGERNLVAVARALMGRPRLVFIDEGSAGLAPQVVEMYWNHLASLVATGVGVVIVEQNVQMVLDRAEWVHLLVGGRVRLSATAEDFRARSDLAALFLGA